MTPRIEASAKKYPFSQVADIGILLTVYNDGLGHAFDVEIACELTSTLEPSTARKYLGGLPPDSNDRRPRYIVSCVLKATHESLIMGSLSWTALDDTASTTSFEFVLEGQRDDIDWESLASDDPYSLEPVHDPADLAGRTAALSQMTATLSAKSVGSFYVYGQKRVGDLNS